MSASQRTDCNVQRKAKEPGFVCTGAPEPDPSDPATAEFPNGIRPAFYRDASVDGSRVFFTSRAELTDDANTGPADDAGNLYECEIVEVEGKPACRLSDLTVDTNDGDVDGAAAVGLVTASEDGSYVYFVANGVLASGAKPGNCITEENEDGGGERTCSLYVEHYGGAGWEPPKFIATLAGGDEGVNGEGRADEKDWIGYEYTENHGILNDKGPGTHTVRVTPDGTRLAFESELSLTGYDNEAAQQGECSEGQGGRCREVYLYDARTGSLVCSSCDPSGGRPVGPAELGGQEEAEQTASYVHPSSFYVPRNLSEYGGRLFFQSPDALAPDDGNGLLDVYEWEQPGSQSEAGDSCTRSAPSFSESDGGCVFPISDVAGGYVSHFMDASASGDDVFIATADQLVAGDTDSRVDVYDVRVGGGFPAPGAQPACDSGESCRGPVAPQPGVFGAPASATFSGAGNLAPPPPAKPVVKAKVKITRCRKGFVKKRGDCVRQAPKKRARERARKSDKHSVKGGK